MLNIVFPNLKLIHGFKKGVIYPTSIVGNGTSEYRINRIAYDKYTWTYPPRSILATSKLELYTFYKAVGGALNSFKFQDPDFREFSGQELDSYTGDKWLFNFPGSVDHPLLNYDASMVIKKNGSVTAWSYSRVNGLALITIAGSNPADLVTVESGNCYLAARFDGPIGWTLEALDTNNNPTVVNMDEVRLIEVFEYA